MFRTKPTRKVVKLTAAQKELQVKADELRKQEAALKDQIKNLPVTIQQKKKQKKEAFELQAVVMAPSDLRMMRPDLRRGNERPVKRKRLRQDRHQGIYMFFAAFIILMLFLLFLWRVAPVF